MENQIVSFAHCGQCLASKPSNISAEEYARLAVGFTKKGEIQIWCNRHDINVALIEDPKAAYAAMLDEHPSGCMACEGGKH